MKCKDRMEPQRAETYDYEIKDNVYIVSGLKEYKSSNKFRFYTKNFTPVSFNRCFYSELELDAMKYNL